MEWTELSVVGAVGALTLLIQIWVAVWDRWVNRQWDGMSWPPSLGYIPIEWMIFMLIFLGGAWIVEWAWRMACTLCE
jgi:hypothetical protein